MGYNFVVKNSTKFLRKNGFIRITKCWEGYLIPKTIEKIGYLTVGYVNFGYYGKAIGSVRQNVYDGDTINVSTKKNFGIRFLGVDAAEMKIPLPKSRAFTSLSSQGWIDFLTDPFAANYGDFDPALDPGLKTHLQNSSGANVATNHKHHADEAEDALEKLITDDMATLGKTKDDFEFFLAFAQEIMDGYGRFLCFINGNQPDATDPEPRPLSYNERLMIEGQVSPYFIWPNIDPYRPKKGSLRKSVVKSGGANTEANASATMKRAREGVKDARQKKKGIFDDIYPLAIQPFEVRFLSRRKPPNRWLIDLGKNGDTLVKPQDYYTITNLEDRLYIPDEYVPLFVEEGWKMP